MAELPLKNEIRGVSYRNIPTSQSHQAILPIDEAFQMVESLDEMIAQGQFGEYDDEGMEIEGGFRVYVEDLDFLSSPMHALVDSIDKILDADFVLEENPDYPSQVEAALNSHIITAINASSHVLSPDSNILVLCAGNGEDLNRLVHYSVDVCKSIDMVGYSPLNPRAATNLRKSGMDYRFFTEYLHKLDLSKLRKSYDMILCHHGLHHILANAAGERAFIEVMRRLSPKGVFIGDKIDYYSLNSLRQAQYQNANSVELISVEDKGIEGTMKVRVRGRIWEDPILSDIRLHRVFNRLNLESGYTMQTLAGHGAWQGKTLYGHPLTPPPTVRHAAYLPESCVMTYVEIKHAPKLPPPVPIVPPPGMGFVWSHEPNPPPGVDSFVGFHINLGQPLQPRDTHYVLYGGSLFSEKSSGFSGRVCVHGEVAWLAFRGRVGPMYYSAPTGLAFNSPTLQLQVEVIERDQAPPRVILLEPVSLGIHSPTGFLSRLDMAHGIIRGSPALSALIELKRWYESWEEVSGDAQIGRWEGVVSMMPSCPPPRRDFTRGARFIKFEYTLDVRGPGGIFEVRRDSGETIRPRPDKDVPNNPEAIRWNMNAVDFRTFDALTRIKMTRDQMESFIASDILERIKKGDFDPEECNPLLKYPYMHVSEFHRRRRNRIFTALSYTPAWGGAMETYRASQLPERELETDELAENFLDVFED